MLFSAPDPDFQISGCSDCRDQALPMTCHCLLIVCRLTALPLSWRAVGLKSAFVFLRLFWAPELGPECERTRYLLRLIRSAHYEPHHNRVKLLSCASLGPSHFLGQRLSRSSPKYWAALALRQGIQSTVKAHPRTSTDVLHTTLPVFHGLTHGLCRRHTLPWRWCRLRISTSRVYRPCCILVWAQTCGMALWLSSPV